jgi:Glycosyltransferase family 87
VPLARTWAVTPSPRRNHRGALATLAARWHRAPAALSAVAVLLVASVGLVVSHHATRQPLHASTAIGDALHSREVVQALARTHWTSASASPLDGQLERVSFSAGAKTVAEVAVRADGTVDQIQDLAHQAVPYGDWIAYEPSVLICLSMLFVLMVGVVPLRRLRNLDLLAVLSLLATVVLLQDGYLTASVLAVLPSLGYLLFRCAWRGLGFGGDPAASTPLFDQLTRGWEPRQRVRVLRLLLATLALVFVMVGVSSPNAVDVAFAVMEGATKVLHGVLPYGHMPGDVLHGDTYPIGSYLLYVPLAWVAPVYSVWSSVEGALALAVLAALVTAAVLMRSAGGRTRRDPGTETVSLRAAIAWLSFPPLMIIVSTGTTDVSLAAMLALAVLLWRRPGASTGMLAVAGWFKLAPFALVPVWLAPRRGRQLAAALAALAGVSAAMIALLVALGGTGGPAAMVHAVAYQFGRGSIESLWSTLGIANLQPLGEAAVLALIAGAVVRLRREAELAADHGRVAALAAAILIGLQLAANYWDFLYLAWILPLAGMSLFADGVGATVSITAVAAVRVPSAA